MNIYVDESVHEQHGFLLLAYVICYSDPQEELARILREHQINEYHSMDKMHGNTKAQELRSLFKDYLNSNCLWGVFVLPSNMRWQLADELPNFISKLTSTCPGTGAVGIYLDEGIVKENELQHLRNKTGFEKFGLYKSHEVNGIQLADLVAALCGVRLREEISQKPKMLEYGNNDGFNHPITAPLGWELWASLRYSMQHSSMPLGDEMPEMADFPTTGVGLHVSERCSKKLREAAEKVFGRVYLGCIH